MYYLSHLELWWGVHRNDPWCPEDPKHWDMYRERAYEWQAKYREYQAGLRNPDEYAREQRECNERMAQHERKVSIHRARDAWPKVAGARYAGCTFDTFKVSTPAMQTALETCREYAAGFSRDSSNLILFGGVGTGKDHLACAVCRVLIEQAWYPLRAPGGDTLDNLLISHGTADVMALVNGPKLLSAARDAMKAGEEAQLMRELVQPGLLVISDPAPPSGDPLTGYQASTITQLIDTRYSDMRPMIVTINCRDREQMDKMLTPPVADRLCHGAQTVPCDWPSYRRMGRVVA